MLFLLFELGKDRYAIEAKRVVEVLPYVQIKRVPEASVGVAGIINYRGEPVPILDFSEVALGTPAREHLSTRIIIVQSTVPGSKEPRLVGMLAEHATELLRKEPREFVSTGLPENARSYYGPVAMDRGRPVQWVREDRLLSEPVKQLLWSSAEKAEAVEGRGEGE